MDDGAIDIVYSVGLAVLSICVVVFSVILFIWCREQRKPVRDYGGAAYDEEAGVVVVVKQSAVAYPLMEIDAATDAFNQRRIIGRGRLGTVYAAVMPKGDVVAVKRIHPRLVLNNPGSGFSSVLRWLSSADHPHVVPIIGFSEAPGERIMVMEFGGMLSLDFYLHQNPDGATLLDWSRRVRIASGTARGLEYLHGMASRPIVHGCVKPSNILVDVKFCARVCDYGLHFLGGNEKEGLAGYVDHEYWEDRKGTTECDVYGFGVVLLELLSGRRCEGEEWVVRWALPLIREMAMKDLLDHRLVIPRDMEPLHRLAKVALACVGNRRMNRPSMTQVAAILSSLEVGSF